MTEGTLALVLAAGAGSRFGGGKLLASIAGRPILQHVLDRLAAAGLTEVVVVLGHDAPAIEASMAWRAERRVVNPDPDRGLASSLAVGFEAISGPAEVAEAAKAVDAVLVVLGDQPLVSVETIRAVVGTPADPTRPFVVPVYSDDRGRNPVLVRRPAFTFIDEATGDRGLGPVLAAHPELVIEVPVAGANPDLDTPADLTRLVEAMWGARVRADREQVERIREVPDGSDFYAPVHSLFRADPTRRNDPILVALLDLHRSGETWLDVGAGAGRFALPLALALDPSGGSVIALDASASMLEGLREIAEDYAIENVQTIQASWPPADPSGPAQLSVDVALMAHVGYDVEAIGPFLDALEANAQRLCVAVLMDRMPASAAAPFWPLVHGEARVVLPALPEFIELLALRGREASVLRIPGEPRRFETRDALEGFVRRQLWIDASGPKESRFQEALDKLAIHDGDGWTIRDRAAIDTGIVTWSPDR